MATTLRRKQVRRKGEKMQKSNLLVVDDSLYMHKMVRAYLEPDPVIVHSTYDGESALAQAAELKPSLILMDMDLPNMDGMEACRRLKSAPATLDTPIIFLTADCSVNDKVKALDLGAVDYITKPFKPEDLRARVRAALRASRVLDQTRMADTLTGLWNQFYLNLNLPVQLSLARRTGKGLSCIAAEVDGIERIHTDHGSDFHDRMLKSMANIFLGQTRTEDVLCHCGQGRFVALLPATARAGAAHVADRIRVQIESQLYLFDQVKANITCSFGIADNQLPGHVSLLESADTAVMRSKNTGGNRVSISGSVREELNSPVSTISDWGGDLN
jgi:diguanylate cyclase (GGDEF)-like protein